MRSQGGQFPTPKYPASFFLVRALAGKREEESDMAFKLPELPYPKDALGDVMSAETLEYHHGKHHRAYVDKTNEMLADKEAEGASLSQVIRDAKEKSDRKLFNNSAQLWNHSFFWQCLCPPSGQRPTGRLAALIDDAFG